MCHLPFIYILLFFGIYVNGKIPFKDKKSFILGLTITLNGNIIGVRNVERGDIMFQISLAAARVNADLSQEHASKKIGVTAKTLRNYEQGKTAIPAHLLKKVAKVYNIPEENIRLPLIDDGIYDEDEFFLSSDTV